MIADAIASPRFLLRGLGVERGPSDSPPQGATDGPITAYPLAHRPGRGLVRALLPHGRRLLRPAQPTYQRCYKSLRRLSDSEVIALALFQQLRGVESERYFPRDAERFFLRLFPGVVGLHPSSFNRRVRKLRCFLEPLRREVLPELVGETETLIVDSTLLEVLHPRQVGQSAGFEGAAWVRWGSFSVYGLKLHPLCATNRVPISYELTAANVGAEVGLSGELLAATLSLGQEKDLLARGLLGTYSTGARRPQQPWPSPASCW